MSQLRGGKSKYNYHDEQGSNSTKEHHRLVGEYMPYLLF